MVVFQALTWESRDVDDEHLVSIFGRAEDGKSVCVTTEFKPYFFIKLNKFVSAGVIYEQIKQYIDSYDVMNCKDLWGFQNNEKGKGVCSKTIEIDVVGILSSQTALHFVTK